MRNETQIVMELRGALLKILAETHDTNVQEIAKKALDRTYDTTV